ncbi:MAG: hypothetical protein V4526_00400 [Patescibacteria group bacterium]
MKYFRIILMMALLVKPEVVESLPDFSKWPDPNKIKFDAVERAYYDHSLESENWAIATVIDSTGRRASAPTRIPTQKKLVISFHKDLQHQRKACAAMAGLYMTHVQRSTRRLVLINVEQMLNEQTGDNRQYRVWPHLGLIFVGTVADEEGYEVVMWDEYAAGPAPLEHLIRQGDIVGLSLVVTGMERGVALAQKAKELGAQYVIAGNDSVIFRANQVMALPDRPIDAVFTDNSLTAVRRFFREIGENNIAQLQIPGVQITTGDEVRSNERDRLLVELKTRKNEGITEDDVFVVPKLELYPHWEQVWTSYRTTFGHKHSNPDTVKNALGLFAQGCTRTRGSDVCSYCSIAGVADVRIPSRDMVARSIEAYNNFGVDMMFNVTDSSYEMHKVIKMLQELGASWKSMEIYGRSQGIARNPHLLGEWQKVATERLLINVGMDSGSDDMLLKGVVKSSIEGCGSRLEENKEAVKRIRQAGAHLHYSLIFGSPGESKETCESSIQFLEWTIAVLGHQLDICETDIYWLNFGSPASRVFHDYSYAERLTGMAGKSISQDEWLREFVSYANTLVVPMCVEESWYRHFTRIDLDTAQAYNQRAAEIMANHTGSIRGRAFRPSV